MTPPQDSVSDVEQYGDLRVLPVVPTEAQREAARASELYKHGDMRLMWVNEGDLDMLLFGKDVTGFYGAVKGYSYPHGREVIVRIHGSGWDVYDPDKHPARAALAVPINKIGEDAIKPPVNGETDPEWAKIRRAIDQFAGRVPSITKHRALHNTHLASVVARLDAAGDREAADTIVWQCWWRALDRERERFLLADAAEARS